MAPVQQEIVRVLEAAQGEMTMSELVDRVEKRQPATEVEVRAAVLPLISSETVILTPDRKLKLRTL
jgi:uncharacterized iron-regulated membrane protein